MPRIPTSETATRRLALGIMFGAELGVIGAALAPVWWLGALVGGGVTWLLVALTRLVPSVRRDAWGARAMRVREPAPVVPAEPRKPYWPQ